jgi:AGCS family alanine or glycine:cation symporter
MNLVETIEYISAKIWSFPFLIAFLGLCIFATFFLRFVQIRYFMESLRSLFSANASDKNSEAGELTSLQAFVNTLGGNIGNGSLSGVPVAISVGGPGSLFWLLVMSTFAVALRYAEVYLGMIFIGKERFGRAKGGPMLYLSMLPGGYFLSYAFAFFCLAYAFICGNVVQCNSVAAAVQKSWNIDVYYTSIVVVAFIGYVLLGGSNRIVQALDKLVPVKVALFFLSALYVLVYHYQAIAGALYLVCSSALKTEAVFGGGLAFTLQKMMATGFQRGIFVHEAGLGTAAVPFGETGGKQPVKDGLMSMLGVYINTHIVCLMVGLCVIASGVWNNGETGSALIISSYQTAFGQYGAWIITFLVVNFGVSVLVSYAYVGRICWNFLTNGKWSTAFIALYTLAAFAGSVMDVKLAWSSSDLVTAGLFVINISGLIWFMNKIKKDLFDYENVNS